jgi:hypothetical protein
MVEQELIMDYLQTSNVIDGIKCPKCGVAYLLEETVVEKVVIAEKMLESK